jgi:hypothetical protein
MKKFKKITMSSVDLSPSRVVDVVLDRVSRYLDQDPCVSEVNWCANCFRLKDYLKVVTVELKSAADNQDLI